MILTPKTTYLNLPILFLWSSVTCFFEELHTTFGTDHFYNADTYNEITLSSNEPSFLAATNKAIYQAMVDVDPDAVFVMQGWLLHNSK